MTDGQIISRADLATTLEGRQPGRRTNYAFNLPGKSFDIYDFGKDGRIAVVPGDVAKLTPAELAEIRGVLPDPAATPSK